MSNATLPRYKYRRLSPKSNNILTAATLGNKQVSAL